MVVAASEIYVLAGVNGAGKSSVAGEMFLRAGVDFFNPDKAARLFRIVEDLSTTHANAAAWSLGKELLERAISERTDHAFETTLGGTTIPSLLRKAAEAGIAVKVWYVGLASIGLHLARVRRRVVEGGHDIPEEKIRERWTTSPANLVMLMPYLSELRVFDNSRDRDENGNLPEPRLLLLEAGRHSRTG